MSVVVGIGSFDAAFCSSVQVDKVGVLGQLVAISAFCIRFKEKAVNAFSDSLCLNAEGVTVHVLFDLARDLLRARRNSWPICQLDVGDSCNIVARRVAKYDKKVHR